MSGTKVYVFGVWIEAGQTMPMKLYPPSESLGKTITKIYAELMDPRNGYSAPANIYVDLSDGSTIHIQARDVLVFEGVEE